MKKEQIPFSRKLLFLFMFFGLEFKGFERVGKRVSSLLILYLTIPALGMVRYVGPGAWCY